MRKDPCAQINLRLDPELARKLKALSAISGRSLNSLISLAIDEYVFLRRATVLQGQKIVDGYAGFDATLKPVRSTEEREALQAAQSQELKSAIQAERTAYAQAQATAPMSMPNTEAQEVENGRKEEAPAPSQTAGTVDNAAPVENSSQTEAQAPTLDQKASQAVEAAPLSGNMVEASQTGNAVEGQNQEQAPNTVQTAEASPAEQKAVKDMSQEELQAFVEDKRSQGVNDYDIAQELRNEGLTCKHIGALIGKDQSSISRNTTGPNGK